MKKALLIIMLLILILLVSCSSTATYSNSVTPTGYAKPKNEYKNFDSYGYDVEGMDLYALAEVLYASGDLYGSYRLFDTIGIDTKKIDKVLHLNEYRKQWTKIKSGLNAYFDFSENPDMYYFFMERQTPGTYSTIPLGAEGPAGGYVFYDCDADNDYGNSDGLKSSECGWRFLEAAPMDSFVSLMWGDNGRHGTQTGIGTGKTNTAIIVSKASNSRNPNAATLCNDYTYGGYDDWFLPSKDELNLLLRRAHRWNRNSFHMDEYWSSSEGDYEHTAAAWCQDFDDGEQHVGSRVYARRVRPVRAF